MINAWPWAQKKRQKEGREIAELSVFIRQTNRFWTIFSFFFCVSLVIKGSNCTLFHDKNLCCDRTLKQTKAVFFWCELFCLLVWMSQGGRDKKSENEGLWNQIRGRIKSGLCLKNLKIIHRISNYSPRGELCWS